MYGLEEYARLEKGSIYYLWNPVHQRRDYLDAALAIIPILVIPFLAERKTKEVPPSAGAPFPEAG